MSEPQRNRLQVDERRAQLLDLGLRLFSTRPYDDVSIDDIASEAGVSKGLLYHYFGGKRAFYAATVALAAERLVDAVTPSETLPPLARLQAGVVAYLGFVTERQAAYLALMHGGLGADSHVLSVVQDSRRRIVEVLLSGLGLADRRPVFRVAARAWIGAVEAAALDWLAHGDLDEDELIVLAVGTLQRLLADAAALDPEGSAGLAPEVLLALGVS